MSVRSRQEQLKYHRYKKSRPLTGANCQFCTLNEGEEMVENTLYFVVIKNLFSYSFWDEQEVTDHLLLIPKLHTATLSDFTTDMQAEYCHLLTRYEEQGFSYYARSPINISKTVTHHHTHFIKMNGRHKKFILYTEKPYVRFVR